MFSERKGIKETDIFVEKNDNSFFQELLFLDGLKHGQIIWIQKVIKGLCKKGNLSEKKCDMYWSH